MTGNLEKAYQTPELWSQTYPRVESLSPQSLLGGLSTHGTGRFERAIKASQELIAADPDFVMAYGGLALSYFLTDRFPEAESTLQRASERKLENPNCLILRYNIAVLKGNQEQMDRAVGLAKGKRRAEHLMAHEEALALALSGDFSRSEALANDLDKRFSEDTFVKFTYAPVLRALAALGRGKPADSVERLQIALRYELASNGLNFNFYLGGLHSAYVRGEALFALHRYAEAAAEFQKILDHRGIVGADPIGALAHLHLGRAYTSSGDNAKAKSGYEEFLTLWKHADSDIPILQQAKAEYAKLQ